MMQPERTDETSFAVLMVHVGRDMGRVWSRRVGMATSRLQVLHEVWHAGEISQAELQQRLGIEGSLITRFVKQMEAARLIKRRPDPKDNRFTLVSLAPPGEELFANMELPGEEFEAALLEGISAREQATLIQALQKVQANLKRMINEKNN